MRNRIKHIQRSRLIPISSSLVWKQPFTIVECRHDFLMALKAYSELFFTASYCTLLYPILFQIEVFFHVIFCWNHTPYDKIKNNKEVLCSLDNLGFTFFHPKMVNKNIHVLPDSKLNFNISPTELIQKNAIYQCESLTTIVVSQKMIPKMIQ